MSAVAEKVIAAFESLPPQDKSAVAREILRRFPPAAQEFGAGWPEKALADMAADPEIQREISRINSEFSAAETDGLGKT
jgi:hypothetical protein